MYGSVKKQQRNQGFIAELILALMIIFLTACGGSSSHTSSSSGVDGGDDGGDDGGGGATESRSIGGGGIKGPLVDAVVTVYEIDPTAPENSFKGDVVTTAVTGDQAQIVGLSLSFPFTEPYILEFTSVEGQTTDIYTGLFPVITTMRTVLTLDLLNSGEQIYGTPLTTMAVDLAALNADSNDTPWDDRDDTTLGDGTATVDEFISALPIAAAQVKSTMGFGISQDIDIFDTPPLIDDSTDTEAEQEDAAAYRAAVEALTAVVDQIDDATGTDDPNAVLSALTSDLADGEIDGQSDGETNDIYDGEGDTADAALGLFDQDPGSLPIPNDPEGRTVGEMKDIIDEEKADLGNDDVPTQIDPDEEVELKPAETDPDLDDDGVPNDEDAFPEDQRYSDDNDGDGIPDEAYTVDTSGDTITRTIDTSDASVDTDDDNDGVGDVDDAFPLDPDEQIDTDGDGVGNNADNDDDGDGTNDSADAFPLNEEEDTDTDQDGIGNNEDTDDDQDGVPDVDDAFPLQADASTDTDGDGTPNTTDEDDDGDGVPDSEDAFPLIDTEDTDTDGDGVGNNTDTDDDGDGVPDSDDAFPTDATEQRDLDADGIGDNTDTDIDGDGVSNTDDQFPRNPFETMDTDGDGIGNNADEDDDGDGVDDLFEEQNGTNPLHRDTDGDGALDNADDDPLDPEVQFDSDQDGVDNASDNCSVHYNPSQSNVDGDERGDACDVDIDGDGVNNAEDAFPDDESETVDTDGDGIGNNTDDDDDGDGVADDSDDFPTDESETVDTDGDGIGNNEDTDDDGDGTDDVDDAFPLDDSEDTDTDGDGIGNVADTDDDGDGVADDSDAFPLVADASTDTDGDGIPNTTDTDDDGDGVADANDAFPLNANETLDTDGDGVGNNTDGDDDNDGVSDDDDAFPLDDSEFIDSDGDGTGNNGDFDDDGDGVADDNDAFPLNPEESVDTDGDGIGNNEDTDDDNDSVPDGDDPNPTDTDSDDDGKHDGIDNCPAVANANQRNLDGDAQGDACDADDDNDDVNDDVDNCPMVPNDQANADDDSLGDACDADKDGDGVDNQVDNCPAEANADQTDTDANGVGDVCDQDSDEDGVLDVLDNCPGIANADQLDTDGDDQGNACDTDDDNDTLTDVDEVDASTGTDVVTDPLLFDTDGDGVDDANDAFPTDSTETHDTDGDGTGDNADTDGDNDEVSDDVDNCPTVANSDQLNTDGDAQGNACDPDDDNDGVNDDFDAFPTNAEESQDDDQDTVGNNADNCPATENTNQADADGDGIGDACDTDDDGDGVGDGDGDNADNCPAVPNPSQIDTDEDGDGDACDTDDDNDTVEDDADNCPIHANVEQGNVDGDDFGDACDADIDGDGLTNEEEDALGTDPEVTDSDEDTVADGTDNCPADANTTQTDTDADGVGDVCDLDTDNDGVPDDEDAFDTDPTETHDTDEDGIGDNGDNCPSVANEDQADADGDGVGDLCDGVPVLSTFYLNERTVNTETENDASGSGLCPFDVDDEMTRVSLWLQEGAEIRVRFGDEGLGKQDGGFAGIDAAGNVTAELTETYEDENGNTADLVLTFEGTLNSDTGVISGTVDETFTYGSAAGVSVAICEYTSSETFTPMSQAEAATVFDGDSGTNGGFVWMDSDKDHGDETDESSFAFFYGLINNVGETEYEYDAEATGDQWPEVVVDENHFILGASGWASVVEQFVVEGTPGSTVNLVSKDSTDTILSSWLVTPFTANVTGEPMLGLVPREWSEEGLTAPDEVFAGSTVLAVGIHAESQLDVYEVECDEGWFGDDEAVSNGLDCRNARIAEWSSDASSTGEPTLATALADVIHATGTVMTEDWQGIRVGYGDNVELLAFITGADTSGAEGTSGAVNFYHREWDTGAITPVAIAAGSWTMTDPNDNNTDLVLIFSLPEAVTDEYDVDDEFDALILTVIDDTSDSSPYVRLGYFTEAGVEHYESGLNSPAIEEVKGNFDYTPPVPDTDGDGITDDTDTDDDNDGVPDDLDAFPTNPEESMDTDGDGVGNNEDTDDDGDGVSDAEEEQQGTDPLVTDSDEDGSDDATDNCPTIANADQADADGDGLGDVCDGVPDISGFWKLEAAVTGAVEDTSSFPGDDEAIDDLCDMENGETFRTLVLIEQDGSAIELLYGEDEFDRDDSDMGSVDASGNVNFGEEDMWNQFTHDASTGSESFAYSVSELFEFMGAVDSVGSPTVITGSDVVEHTQAFAGENQTGDVLLDCEYTLSATFTRMTQVDASTVLSTTGTHQGFAFVEVDDDYIEATDLDVYDFFYATVDDNGEVGREWNESTSSWDTETPEGTYMLGTGGWAEVPEFFVVEGTPATTAVLARKAGDIVYSSMLLSAYATSITGDRFEGYVDEDFVDQLPNPDATFSDTDASAIAIDVVQQQDAYEFDCDSDSEILETMDISCRNGYVADWSNWPEVSPADLADAFSDVLHSTDAESSVTDKGLPLGYGMEGSVIYAFLTGSDTSGVVGATGTVHYVEHKFNAAGAVDIFTVGDSDNPLQSTWEIVDPLADGNAVLRFELPEALFEEFDIHWRDSSTVIMALVAAGDTSALIRVGGMSPADNEKHLSAINIPALTEVLAGFDYSRPDTDSDGFTDDVDNCPADANEDQADTDENGVGDVCEDDSSGGTTGDPDGDGVFEDDNCPAVSNPDQTDSDGDGVGDACETSTPTAVDTDSDGILDSKDAFPEDASEQFDTDGDGVGDNTDNCVYVENAGQEDTGNDATLGDACDVVGVPDMSGMYLLSWNVETDNPSNQEYDDDTDSCTGVTDAAGHELVRIEQVGNQVIMYGEDNEGDSGDADSSDASGEGDGGDDGDWMDIGTIDVDGNFTINGGHNSDTESFVLAGIFNESDGAITATFTDSRETSDASATCTHTGSVSGVLPFDVAADTVVPAGLSWFEADNEWDESTGTNLTEFEYGTINDTSVEQLFLFSMDTESWDDVSSEEVGTAYFVDDSEGVVNGDDLFIVDGYQDSGNAAVIKVTSGGNGTVEEWSNEVLTLGQIMLSGLEMKLFLPEFGEALGDATFSSDAQAYLATLSPAATVYEFWCDDDWNSWFDTNLTCDNVVAKSYTDLNGDGEDDPVAAVSFDELISTAAELDSPTDEVAGRGMYIGQGEDDAGEYQVQAFLQTDDGTGTGANGVVHFMKRYDPSTVFTIGTAPLVSSTVGGVDILEFAIPELIAMIADRDGDERGIFIFVEQTLDSTPLVRMGEVLSADDEGHELLFNDAAKTEILAAFSIVSVPQSFLDASDNGLSFSEGASSTSTDYGIGGVGLFREWESDEDGTEVTDYYVFSDTDDTGRWVHIEWDLSSGDETLNQDEAMTWSIDEGTGNLHITITSDSSEREIALENMDDLMRPSIIVKVDGVVDELNTDAERMITQAGFAFEAGNLMDLTADADVIGSYHFATDPMEQLIINGDGSFVENEPDSSGTSIVQVGSGTWVLDTSTELITLTYSDGTALIGFESIDADTADIDNDGDTSEDVYSMAGWEPEDADTGLGLFFRDKLLLLP